MRPYLSNPLSKIRAAKANKPHEYVIDGSSYTLQQIAHRLGINRASLSKRMAAVRAGTLKNTWADLSAKRA